MSGIKGHFDGNAVVLDEPVSLAIGQQVRVVIDSSDANLAPLAPGIPSKVKLGAWKGKLLILEEGDDIILDHFKDYLP
jgi:hypothetical protein